MKTEQIKCILCNKQLDLRMFDGKELFICSECQAYFCPNCLKEISNYRFCPAASLLGVKEHAPKFLKLLPPKPVIDIKEDVKDYSSIKVKILPRKSVTVLDEKISEKRKKAEN